MHGADGVPRDRQTHDAAPLASLSGVVAAGEALNPEVLHAWHEAIGRSIRDGYGQTETGQLTGAPLDEPPRPGSMGKPLPGVKLTSSTASSVLHPESDPTFFVRYLGDAPHPARGTPATASPRTRTATCSSRAAPTT